MISNKIKQAIERIGYTPISQDYNAPLEQSGLDSLMLALLIIELERDFQIKIPVIPLKKEHFESIASIEKHLLELGVK